MPVKINDLSKSVKSTPLYTPKFFSTELTGTGGARGLLCVDNNPNRINRNIALEKGHINCSKSSYTNGDTQIAKHPFYILSEGAWSDIIEMKSPDLSTKTLIASDSTRNISVYADMVIHSITTEKTTKDNKVTSKTFTACYQMMIYVTSDNTKDKTRCRRITNTNIAYELKEPLYGGKTSAMMDLDYTNVVASFYTVNPCMDLKKLTDSLSNDGYAIMTQNIVSFFSNYSVYDAVTARSEEWQCHIDEVIELLVENIKTHNRSIENLMKTLRHIESYKVPLDLYRKIYNILRKHFAQDIVTKLCKNNLNLLLSDTLNNLNNNKSKLTHIPANVQSVATPKYYSSEQKVAIESKEPLILVQAGAGTGKSTVILGRIEYMCKAGIDPSDITVISFTNAAADNITERNPHVHSMTISKMIHMIYTENYPNHELSSIDTIINSIDIYYKYTDTVAQQFKKYLMDVRKRSSLTDLNNYIEEKFDDIIRILDRIGQTSLELESIIAYHKIDVFKEPNEVKSKYLIIDEVQDNSVFDFIYTLKYVDKHNESLFIVGDCAQTLYEFRASNPRTLNILEASGVFASYQLQINYRSNQEILDFANIALRDIEANQYANIQLQANSLASVTESSFKNAVQLTYKQLNKITDFHEALGPTLSSSCYEYINDKIKAGEQVAFLAYQRQTVNYIEKSLRTLFPSLSIVSLVPKKMYNSTIFSEYIKKYWSSVQFMLPCKNIINSIAQDIYNKLPYIVRDSQRTLPFAQIMIKDWYTESGQLISSYHRLYTTNAITMTEFLDKVKESMISFEIKHNAVKQALLSAQNQSMKDENSVQNANFIISTIHSAKGREFDNVVIVHRNENQMSEENKRMYYVAFTRAKKSEYILSYDTVKGSKIENDYKAICKMLEQKTKNAQMQSVINTPVMMPTGTC